mgnify:CR=1 FL=1
MSLVGKELEVTFAATMETLESEDDSTTEGEDAHAPLSPATGAEALFMSGLQTDTVSANFLATELRKNSRRSSANSAATGDFQSCYDNYDDLLKSSSSHYNRLLDANNKENGIKQPIYNFDEEPKKMPQNTINVDEVKVDAAGHVYEHAKKIW